MENKEEQNAVRRIEKEQKGQGQKGRKEVVRRAPAVKLVARGVKLVSRKFVPKP